MDSRKKIMNDTAGKEFYTAFTKAQTAMKSPEKSTQGYNYKYADFVDIINASRSYLVMYGLSVQQPIDVDDEGKWWLITRIVHDESAQYIQGRAGLMPPWEFEGGKEKSVFQAFGSQLTYMRRYCYVSMLGLVPDEDDDGASANIKKQDNFKKGPVKPECINDAELSLLVKELEGYPEIEAKLVEHLNIQDLFDVPRSVFNTSLSRIREIKSRMQLAKKE